MAASPPRLLDSLLTALGVTAVSAHDAATSGLHAELAAHGITGTVTKIRWGTVTIRTDNSGAALLAWHHDRLEELAARLSGGTVTKVRVHVDHAHRADRGTTPDKEGAPR